ncbi:MAG: hypothetical protein KDD66_03955 [Bdellovibrionales bacterium]|nr:hypothetical protein [Bdellovibrionales bacterium]
MKARFLVRRGVIGQIGATANEVALCMALLSVASLPAINQLWVVQDMTFRTAALYMGGGTGSTIKPGDGGPEIVSVETSSAKARVAFTPDEPKESEPTYY